MAKPKRHGDLCWKIKYHSEREAAQALKKARKHGCVEWYLCPLCDGEVYHLTSSRTRRG